MAKISFDGQSFSINGQRVWLISAGIHYPRTPHQLWRARIRAAKQAGFNTIETYCFWNAHEPSPGEFDFSGDLDLRRFVEIIAEEGMYCILRPGPYVCSEWDFGGQPAWLHTIPDCVPRTNNPAYLQACARYLDAIMAQVRDLQITTGGPILMVQNENEWFCANSAEDPYHLELSRLLRESGCTVPLINCNNLWQPVTGTMDCWNGWRGLLSDMRQLRVARPEQPRLVTELWPGWFDAWGHPNTMEKTPQDLLHGLASASAGNGQFNLYMFHGGTNFGFWGGRTVGGSDQYMITSYDYDAPLTEAGARTDKYDKMRRLTMFLSHFSDVLAFADPAYQPAAREDDLQILHQRGSRGEIIYVLKDKTSKVTQTQVLTPDGQRVPVTLGKDRAAWFVRNVRLGQLGQIDLTNLRPWAVMNETTLILFGPAGSEGFLSLDGAFASWTIPNGKKPIVDQLGDATIIVMNQTQVDAAYISHDQQLYIGIAGFDDQDQPLPRDGWATCSVIDAQGKLTSRKSSRPTAPRAPQLKNWQHVREDRYVTGEHPRFAVINGPLSLESCGADYGYGWYRIQLKQSKARTLNLLLPEANDRLHLYRDGKLEKIFGFAAGATTDPVKLKLPAGESQLVFLADNLGRFNYSDNMGERKGLFGHLLDVKPIKLPKVEISEAPFEPLDYRPLTYYARRGDRSPKIHRSFTINHRKKKPLVLVFDGKRSRSMIFVNDQYIDIDAAEGVMNRLVIPPDQLKQGNNEFQIISLQSDPEGVELRDYLRIYEVVDVVSESADWSYARWSAPESHTYTDLPSRTPALPAWYRTTFKVKETATPLWLETNGLCKGQIYLNGYNVGRYFSHSPTGKAMHPQQRYYLPEPWLNPDGENELILFDEHGKHPTAARLVYDANGPFGRK